MLDGMIVLATCSSTYLSRVVSAPKAGFLTQKMENKQQCNRTREEF